MIHLLQYMAPECFVDHLGSITVACDVYSSALVVAEMMSHTPPWKGLHEFNIIYQGRSHRYSFSAVTLSHFISIST